MPLVKWKWWWKVCQKWKRTTASFYFLYSYGSILHVEVFLSQLSDVVFSSFRRWRGLGGLGEWYELLAREPLLHLWWSADRVYPTTAQRTDLCYTPPPPPPPPSSSLHTTQPATAGSPLTHTKPCLPRAAICDLTPNRPQTVTAHAHPRCQVGAYLNYAVNRCVRLV